MPVPLTDAGLTAFLLSFLDTRDAFALSAVMAPVSADFRTAMTRFLSCSDDGACCITDVPLDWLERAYQNGVWTPLPTTSSGQLRLSLAQIAEASASTSSVMTELHFITAVAREVALFASHSSPFVRVRDLATFVARCPDLSRLEIQGARILRDGNNNNGKEEYTFPKPLPSTLQEVVLTDTPVTRATVDFLDALLSSSSLPSQGKRKMRLLVRVHTNPPAARWHPFLFGDAFETMFPLGERAALDDRVRTNAVIRKFERVVAHAYYSLAGSADVLLREEKHDISGFFLCP